MEIVRIQVNGIAIRRDHVSIGFGASIVFHRSGKMRGDLPWVKPSGEQPGKASLHQFFNLLFGGRQKPGPLVDFVTRQIWRTDQSIMAHRLRLVEEFNLDQRMERLRMPTLILAGDRDLLVSERSLRALSNGVPHAELVRLTVVGGKVALDRERMGGGRGAWIHPRAGSLTRALKRRAESRSNRSIRLSSGCCG